MIGDDEVDSGACWAITVATNAITNKYSYIQIWNPANSNKRIYLDDTIARSIPDQEMGLVWTPSALGQLININVYNMKNGVQSGSVAEIRIGNSAEQLLYPFVDFQFHDQRFARVPVRRSPIIDPGHGIALTDYATFVELIAGFFWRECPIPA